MTEDEKMMGQYERKLLLPPATKWLAKMFDFVENLSLHLLGQHQLFSRHSGIV